MGKSEAVRINIRPIGDHILVRVQDPEQVSSGGILLPDNAKGKPTRGKVVAVGSGQLLRDGNRVASETVVGDVVLFTPYSGASLDGLEDDGLVLLREQDILAVVG